MQNGPSGFGEEIGEKYMLGILVTLNVTIINQKLISPLNYFYYTYYITFKTLYLISDK